MNQQARQRLENFFNGRGNPIPDDSVRPLTPDASTREYFRIESDGHRAIACVYPPDDAGRAQLAACIDVTGLFLGAGLPVARILDADQAAGIIVHEDFGDTILRDVLAASDPERREKYINNAIRLIARIQAATSLAYERGSVASRLSFDFDKLSWELGFFTTHYFGSLRRRDPNTVPRGLKGELDSVARDLERYARVLTHRDFHAANLMLVNGELKIIDHQDARIGSPAYDLVSLLLDRVTELPSAEWLASKRTLLIAERESLGLGPIGENDFADEFRLQTIQRCLKAIGTFSYQSANRGKRHFEQYIDPMFGIVLRAVRNLDRYPVLERVIVDELSVA